MFAREIYDPGTVVLALKSVGINKDPEALIELGEKIYLLKHRLRIKLGYDSKNLRFPKRLFATKSLGGISMRILLKNDGNI